jgi:Sec-independent protein translocase protein TatA
MFGLTFEKLLLIGVIAVFVLGPERLPGYTAKFAQFIRSARNMANGAKERMRDEMGPDFDDVDWKKLDPRQYDPRRIIREALLDDDPPTPAVRPVTRSASEGRPEPAYLQHKAKSAGGPVPVTDAGGGAVAAAGAGVIGVGGAALAGAGGSAAGSSAGGSLAGAAGTAGAGAAAAAHTADDAGQTTFDDTPFPGEVPAPGYDSEAT